jgi:hypothetical protein
MAAPTAITAITRTTTNGRGVAMKSMRPCETNPTSVKVTKSPRHAAIGGAILSVRLSVFYSTRKQIMLPGSSPSLLQMTTRKHMKEPRRALERQAAPMAVADTRMYLDYGVIETRAYLENNHVTYSDTPNLGAIGAGG